MYHNFAVGIMEDAQNVTVKDLLKVLYEKACQQKLWGLVRHTAGMLGKRVEDLAKALTDLLVRQKQVTYISASLVSHYWTFTSKLRCGCHTYATSKFKVLSSTN
jgi:hypothetical protein